MTDPFDRVILIVDDDHAQLEALRILLTDNARWRIDGAGGAREAMARLQAGPIAAVLADQEMPGIDGLTLLDQIRHDPLTAQLPVLLLTANGEIELCRRAWALGVDAILQKPTHPAILRSVLDACIRRHEEAAVVAEHLRLAELSVVAMVDLVVRQLDVMEPGARRRGESVAMLADTIGTLFEMEPMHAGAMRTAARLYEIGRIMAGAGTRQVVGPRGVQGRDTIASAAILRTIPMLELVATIVEGMGANWDGSGFPAQLQRGQITLRSRILRVAVDLQSVIPQPGGAPNLPLDRAIAALEMHTGTWYDPGVIAVLHLLADSTDGPIWDPDVVLLNVEELRVGMQLASDLNTASGIKLLSSGAILSAPNLDLVRKRHDRDPIPNGVAIRHRRDVDDGTYPGRTDGH